MEYQEEAPMPSMRGDKRSFDKIIRESKRPRKARVNMTLDEEAEEWLERVAKHNRKRRRPPYNKSSVANKIILEHKATLLARVRAKKGKT